MVDLSRWRSRTWVELCTKPELSGTPCDYAVSPRRLSVSQSALHTLSSLDVAIESTTASGVAICSKCRSLLFSHVGESTPGVNTGS